MLGRMRLRDSERFEQARMAPIAARGPFTGWFILTMSDCEETRAIYGRVPITSLELSYSAGCSNKTQPEREIIVTSHNQSRNDLFGGVSRRGRGFLNRPVGYAGGDFFSARQASTARS